MSRHAGKNAVVVARVPDDFAPPDFTAVPDRILEGDIRRPGVALGTAQELVRKYNTDRLIAGVPVKTWAMVVRFVRAPRVKGGAL
jgi:hypothetical protein